MHLTPQLPHLHGAKGCCTGERAVAAPRLLKDAGEQPSSLVTTEAGDLYKWHAFSAGSLSCLQLSEWS